MATKSTRIVAISFILCFILCLAAGPMSVRAWGRPKKIEFDYQYQWTSVGIPDEEWTDDDGWYHNRGFPHYGEVLIDGEVVGSITYVGDLDLELATFSGSGHGRQTITLAFDGKTGSISCIVFFRITGGYLEGLIIGWGRGDFRGLHLGISTGYPWAAPIFTVDGILIG